MMQPSHYNAVVEERALDNLCGYPACSNTLPKRDKVFCACLNVSTNWTC